MQGEQGRCSTDQQSNCWTGHASCVRTLAPQPTVLGEVQSQHKALHMHGKSRQRLWTVSSYVRYPTNST